MEVESSRGEGFRESVLRDPRISCREGSGEEHCRLEAEILGVPVAQIYPLASAAVLATSIQAALLVAPNSFPSLSASIRNQSQNSIAKFSAQLRNVCSAPLNSSQIRFGMNWSSRSLVDVSEN